MTTNHRAKRSTKVTAKSKKVRVAIVGVGNCASSLVQGVQFYQDAPIDAFVPGLMHTVLGGYHVGDIEFSAAFDIDADKVGKDLSAAIFGGNTVNPTPTATAAAPIFISNTK